MSQLLKLATQFEAAGQSAQLLKLGQYSEAQLRHYLDQVPCIFGYRYADNPVNRKRKRVGRSSGFRQGVRNPNFIPAEKHAATKGTSTKYYDLGRQAWRMWRAGHIITVTAFWSVELLQFVDTPEEAGIVGGKPFSAAPAEEPTINTARAARTAKREATKNRRDSVTLARALRR
jgi:hypothetical protein